MKRFLIFSCTILMLGACRKLDEYPIVPTLQYKSLDFVSDQTGRYFVLTTTVTDGDGDIGYKQDESNGDFDNPKDPYYYNYVLTMEVLDNKIWKEYKILVFNSNTGNYDTASFNISVRLPYLTPDGKNKGFKAEIEAKNFLPDETFFPSPLPYFADTLRIKAFVYDRERHQSNTIETPAFFIDTR